MIETLKNILFGHKCVHCGKRELESYSRYYNRAYNSLCKQATSDLGQWCNNCLRVNWEEPDFDKWINNQPTWIISHFDSYQSKRTDYIVHRDELKPYAVFAIACKDGLVAATTRPYDTNVKYGLPGGKVDPGETPIQAVNRECQEEGWNIVIEEGLLPFHCAYVDGKPIHWYLSVNEPTILDDYKEKSAGIIPILVEIKELGMSGYGNECLLKLLKDKPVDIIEIVKGTWVEEYCEVQPDYKVYFRYDLYPECDSKEQWDKYIDLQDELSEFGVRFADALLEHDCISGYLILI